MYVRNKSTPMNQASPKIQLFFPHSVFNVQHAEIVNASEHENLGPISTSMQSLRANECDDLII